MIIKVERIYTYPTENNNDGFRILIDRLWPQRLRKEDVRVDFMAQRYCTKCFVKKMVSHDENKWNEFKTKYFKELEKNNESVNMILGKASEGINNLTIWSKK